MTSPTNELSSQVDKRVALSLLMLRAGIATVFLMWTVDKFVNPEHAAAVFKKFYMIPSLSNVAAYAIGGLQLAVILAFLVGWLRTWTYGAVLGLHAVSTFSSWEKYIDPWTYPNLLFFAAIPMLAACISLWLLRDLDSYSLDGWLARKNHEGENADRVAFASRDTHVAELNSTTVTGTH